ncbi:pyridoxamine 5'-phosphate oxidase family protein [Streptomyces cavernicola]|uniref:Pyridoxamine 5'-phosphate oxidase family protein n=1 Tax=Streptomyces cavernicola TaxID=3043613 RepID=A0ABT6SI24_9ACTN|nr:pyridoxamine 5'-phosphate oxidase family protein [Streptomyces sp. B-S-A6]MDI3407851.1 pyridoxamine 5'-phosphate oxidase family protein [Streptomyces sp. B-S-A6]
MAIDPRDPGTAYLSFWRERHVCTLTTLRPNGTPHVVPVGVTYDPEAGVARVISSKSSKKVGNVLAGGVDGAPASVCQFAGRLWATLEGRARVVTEPEAIADAERRYAERYERTPSPNPNRVVIEITLTGAMGSRALRD